MLVLEILFLVVSTVSLASPLLNVCTGNVHATVAFTQSMAIHFVAFVCLLPTV